MQVPILKQGAVLIATIKAALSDADLVELRNALGDGFAESVRMLLTDRSRLAANAGRVTNRNRIELRRAVYSPCDLCQNDPSAPPAWQFVARQIDDDREFKLLEMRDVAMQLDGLPIFYFPYLSMPDPSVKRASGFLTPSFGGSNSVGANFTLPYFLAGHIGECHFLNSTKSRNVLPHGFARRCPVKALGMGHAVRGVC